MRVSHTLTKVSSSFDEPNLVSAAGLVPIVGLAQKTGLGDLVDKRLTLKGYFGANAGLKVMALVAGMVAGADSIDDMALLRHGGMRKLFIGAYAPSTLGSFLRAFKFGHVRQLDAVASRWLKALTVAAPLVGAGSELTLVDIDDTIKAVHGYQKEGSGYGYSGVRGLNALIGVLSSTGYAPVIIGARLRKGACNSARGAKKFVSDVLTTTKRLRGKAATGFVLLRADSAFYAQTVVAAAARAGAFVSITVRMNPDITAAIGAIPDDAWETIQYTNAVFDEETDRWVSAAEVAEAPYVAFGSKKKAEQITGRLIVRRIPDLNQKAASGQGTMFTTYRYHAFFTTISKEVLGTVAADKTHRQHAIVEQVHADLKGSALAHLPSGSFAANGAWLVLATIAFNLTRAAGTLAGGQMSKAVTATIRRTLINVPARITSSARRIRLRLPDAWPWETHWTALFDTIHRPPQSA